MHRHIEYRRQLQNFEQASRQPLDIAANMSNSLNKIAANSPSRQNPSEIETSIANASDARNPQLCRRANTTQALTDLENNVPDLKSSLRPLQFVSAREV